jgi:hypothetical protein
LVEWFSDRHAKARAIDMHSKLSLKNDGASSGASWRLSSAPPGAHAARIRIGDATPHDALSASGPLRTID